MNVPIAHPQNILIVRNDQILVNFGGTSPIRSLVQRHQNAGQSTRREGNVVLVTLGVQVQDTESEVVRFVDHRVQRGDLGSNLLDWTCGRRWWWSWNRLCYQGFINAQVYAVVLAGTYG